MIVPNSKSDPSCAGHQRLCFTPYSVLPAEPCTTSMHARRFLGDAAVFRNGVCAGTIAASQGNVMADPRPRRTARRDTCFFVMNIGHLH